MNAKTCHYVVSGAYLVVSLVCFANAALQFGGGTRVENAAMGAMTLFAAFNVLRNARKKRYGN